jgi:putative ABC transport system permease protein
MRTQDLFQSALQSLARNKGRSILTVLGIVIGIGAVIVMLSVGQGAQQLILDQVADLGSDQLFVQSGSPETSEGPPDPFIEQTVTLEDAKALRDRGPFSAVTTLLLTNTTVSSETQEAFVDIAGVDEYQLDLTAAEIANGRFFDSNDINGFTRTAVLGSETANDFFGDADPVGQGIEVKGINFKVVGVMEPQGSQFFSNLDKRVYLPVTSVQRDIMNVDYVSYINARASGNVDLAKDEARAILRDTHNIVSYGDDMSNDDFTISSQEDAVQTISVVGSALSALLASIAAISLVVGGIGIMNIMLVSVTERTKEIGLRKSIGATEREILQQFLIEAVVLTLLGGLLGILGGVTFAVISAQIVKNFVEGWSLVIPPSAIVLAVIVSSVVGLGFGIYPARRAAKLDPIEALRYE